MSLFAEDVPEGDGTGFELEAVDLELLHALGDLGIVFARLADSGEVALNVGGEDRHADAAEGFGHNLQGDGLAGAGGSGNQAVAIGQAGKKFEIVARCGLGND